MTDAPIPEDVMQIARESIARVFTSQNNRERLAKAILAGNHDDYLGVVGCARAILAERPKSSYANGFREGLEIAAELCREQAKEFLSPEYATNQPFSSLSERFACGACEKAIHTLVVSSTLKLEGKET